MDKRERGNNFTETEKEILLRLARKHYSIIENKKTDGRTVKKKIDAWKRIAEQFNEVFSTNQRNAIQLKNFYNNHKRKLKRDKTDDKVSKVMRTAIDTGCFNVMYTEYCRFFREKMY